MKVQKKERYWKRKENNTKRENNNNKNKNEKKNSLTFSNKSQKIKAFCNL